MNATALPEQLIHQRLTGTGLTLATAESCSGGLIAHRITNAAGASEYFAGGVVAYSNAVKTAILGVPEDLLERYGAVSDPVARAMAEGTRSRLGASVAVSVTGIAGPGGGTPEKPVGLVYIAVSGPQGVVARECRFSGSREEIKQQTAETALRLLVEYLG